MSIENVKLSDLTPDEMAKVRRAVEEHSRLMTDMTKHTVEKVQSTMKMNMDILLAGMGRGGTATTAAMFLLTTVGSLGGMVGGAVSALVEDGTGIKHVEKGKRLVSEQGAFDLMAIGYLMMVQQIMSGQSYSWYESLTFARDNFRKIIGRKEEFEGLDQIDKYLADAQA